MKFAICKNSVQSGIIAIPNSQFQIWRIYRKLKDLVDTLTQKVDRPYHQWEHIVKGFFLFLLARVTQWSSWREYWSSPLRTSTPFRAGMKRNTADGLFAQPSVFEQEPTHTDV
jgi:hypothetical protein